MYLVKNGKPHWTSTVPALLMTAVTCSYLLQAKEGFMLPAALSNGVGTLIAAAVLALFLQKAKAAGHTADQTVLRKAG